MHSEKNQIIAKYNNTGMKELLAEKSSTKRIEWNKDILAMEFGIPGAGATSSGGTKNSVSFRGWNEMLPNT